MAFSMSLEYLPPTIRIPDINDKSIGFPFAKFETVSVFMLPVSEIIIIYENFAYIFVSKSYNSYSIWVFLLLLFSQQQ